MAEQNEWVRITQENPDHSTWYIERFRSMAAAGDDLHGEARMIDAMVERGARILDAGCGPGRVGGYLAGVGHEVVGVDIDPVLIAAAVEDHPSARWLVGDLSELDLAAQGIPEGFDVVVCAGNVMTFLAPSTRVEVLRRMGTHLRDGGRVVLGFGTTRGYEPEQLFADARSVGLVPDLLLSTWSLRPYEEGSSFLVAVLRPEPAEAGAPGS